MGLWMKDGVVDERWESRGGINKSRGTMHAACLSRHHNLPTIPGLHMPRPHQSGKQRPITADGSRQSAAFESPAWLTPDTRLSDARDAGSSPHLGGHTTHPANL